ncbi:MAG: hypothetical protein AAF193_06955 [Bacteroidota bacterium]
MKAKQESKICSKCGQRILHDPNLNTDSMDTKKEEEIIERLSNQVLTKTMEAVTPLLEKLQEANQQQLDSAEGPVESYEDQIRKMQESAMQRLKVQEQKIQEKMKKLQMKVSGIS